MCRVAGKSTPVEVTASGVAESQAPVAPSKTKAKKVPRYVKEALKEVEQEKASRLAATQVSQVAKHKKAKPPSTEPLLSAAAGAMTVKQAAAKKKSRSKTGNKKSRIKA